MEMELRLLAGRVCLSDRDFIRLYDSLEPDVPEQGSGLLELLPRAA